MNFGSVHTLACVFCVNREFGKFFSPQKGFQEAAATVFEEKSHQIVPQSLQPTFQQTEYIWNAFAFIFPKSLRNRLSSHWISSLKIVSNLFWKGRIVIKTKVVCFSPCSFTFKSMRCDTMSGKNPRLSVYSFHWFKSWKFHSLHNM